MTREKKCDAPLLLFRLLLLPLILVSALDRPAFAHSNSLLDELTFPFQRSEIDDPSVRLEGSSNSAAFETHLAGVVNHYTRVRFIRRNCNHTEVTVDDSLSFVPGDRILVIQMNGARIDTTNSAAFGSIINLGATGVFEFATVLSVNRNIITLDGLLTRQYDTTTVVQMIRVARGSQCIIDSAVTAPAWNGRTGGIVAIEADTLILNAAIDVSVKGFRGGRMSLDMLGGDTTWYKFAFASGQGGQKGEGFTSSDSLSDAGRGARANGGGGGNNHNSGGAGGGNAGAGGRGGWQINSRKLLDIGGVGGKKIIPSNTDRRVVLGGGGGGGHQNNSTGSDGMNGGGIVIVRARLIQGNGHSITARGGDQTTESGNDGAGGGGAGGSVLLFVDRFDSTLTVDVSGGKGGDVNNGNIAVQCHGPGGGGGGGVVWYSAPMLPLNVKVRVLGGASGMNVRYPSPCLDQPYGALAGEDGAILSGLQLPESRSVPPMTLTRSPDQIICRDSCMTLRVSIHDGAKPYSIQWTPQRGLTSPNDTTTLACPDSTTSYIVTIADSVGCMAQTNILIVVATPPATPTIQRTGDTLTSSPALRYQWFVDGKEIPRATGRRHFMLRDGKYSVRVYDSLGCWSAAPALDLQKSVTTIRLICPARVEFIAGERFTMQLMLAQSSNLIPSATRKFVAHLRFKKNVVISQLDPLPPFIDAMNERTLIIRGERAPLATSGILLSLPFMATLGDTSCTQIVLDSLVWLDGAPLMSYETDRCFLCLKLCEEGGHRLIFSDARLRLHQNRPNPFNALTTIDYELIESGWTELFVVDMLGRRLMTLDAGDFSTGKRSVTFDASRLVSGLYLYLLRTPTRTLMKRMQLVK